MQIEFFHQTGTAFQRAVLTSRHQKKRPGKRAGRERRKSESRASWAWPECRRFACSRRVYRGATHSVEPLAYAIHSASNSPDRHLRSLLPPSRHVFTDRERITDYAEVGGVPTTASRSNGRLGSGTEPGVPVVASEMLVLFERIEDDWTEPGPASKRRRAAA
jgi:hypothetical protein